MHGHARNGEGHRARRTRRPRNRRPLLEGLESRSLLSLTVQFADAVGVVGLGSVDVESNSVTNDAQGNVYVTGSLQGTADFDPGSGVFNLSSTGGRDIFVAKYSPTGALLWVKDLKGGSTSSVAQGTAVVVDASGNVVVGGTFTGTVNFDPNGGTTSLSAPIRNDGFVARYDSSGNLLWVRAVTGVIGDYDEVYALAVDASGNIAAGGSFQNTATFGGQSFTSGGTFENFVTKLSASGQFLWTAPTTGSGASSTQTTGLAFDASGNVVATGFVAGLVDFDPGAGVTALPAFGSRDVFVQKLDANGNLVWAKGLGSGDIDQGNSVAVDASGNVYVTGTFAAQMNFDPSGATQTAVFTPGGFLDAFLLKLDASGSFIWARDLATTGYYGAQGTGVGLDAFGHVYLAGYFQGSLTLAAGAGGQLTSAGSSDAFVGMYDTSGIYLGAQSYGGSNFDAGFGVGVNASGYVAIAGRYTGPATFGSTTLPLQPNKSIFIGQIFAGPFASVPGPPSAPALDPASDSGSSATDGVTTLTTLKFTVGSVASAGNLVELFRDGVVVASRTGAGALIDPGPVPAGIHTYTARQTDPSTGASPQSSATTVTVILTIPAAQAAPALSSADDSGVVGDGLTNVRTPRLVGTADPNTLVQLLDLSGSVLATTTTSVAGAYSLAIPSSLADGVYGLRVREVDLAGNFGTPSPTYTLTILATPPATPSTPALLAADDSGSPGDGITNVVLPHLVGSAAAGMTVQLLTASNTVIGTATATGGSYSVQPSSALADGTYSLRVQLVDAAGNVSSPSGTLSLTILATKPATPGSPMLLASDDSGTQGDGLTNVRQPHLNGTATPGLTIQLVNASNVVIGSAAAGSSYSVQPTTPLTDGTYVLRVQAVDAAGNVSAASSPFTLSILATAPSTPSYPTLLAADDSGALGDGLTNVRQPHFIGTATLGVTIQVVNASNTVIGSTVAGSTYSVQPANPLADGTYVLRFQAVDAAGNVSVPSAVFTMTIVATSPGSPSTPSLLSADDSGAPGDGLTNVRQPRLTGTATAGLTIQLVNASNVVIGSAVAGSTYSVQPSNPLADGTYVLHVQAVDGAGNVSASSGAFTLTILATAPATPSTPTLLSADDSGTPGDGITNVRQPRLTGTATTGQTIQLINAANTVIGTASAVLGGYVVAPTTALANGTYSLRVQAVDAAGNVSGASGAFSLTVLTATPATPSTPSLVAADDSGTLGDGITNVRQPRLTGTASSGLTIQLLNASNTVIGSVVAGSTYTIQPSAPLTDSTYVVRVQAVDVAGNVSAAGGTFTLTILATPPATPAAPTLLAADDAGTLGDGVTNVRQPRLSGTASPNATVQWIDSNGNVVGTGTAGAGGVYTVAPSSPLVEGTYSARVRVLDAAGNMSVPSPTFTLVIETGPVAPTSAPTLVAADDSGTLGDDITRVAQPRLTGTVAAGSTVQIVDASNKVYGSAAVGGGGSYTVSFASPLADGVYAFSVRVLDASGVPSGASPTLSLTIMTAMPNAPGMAVLLPADDSGAKGDGLTNATRPRFTGIGPANTTIQLLDGSFTTIGSASSASDGSFTVAPGSALSDGTYTFWVRTLDAAGNGSLATGPIALTILATPPAAPGAPTLLAADDTGVVGDGVTKVRQPHLVGTAKANTPLTLLDAANNVLGSSVVASDGSYSVQPATALADGVYALHVQVVDAAGNASALSGAFTLTISNVVIPPPPVAPSSPRLAPADDSGAKGDGLTNVRQPHLIGTGTIGTTVQVVDARLNVLGSAVVAADGTYSVLLTSPLADGTYALDARALDSFNQYSPLSADATLTILATSPATPSAPSLLAADDSGTLGDGVTRIAQPRFTGTAASGLTIQLINASNVVLATTTASANGYTIQPTSALADGVYSVRVQAVDAAGNVSAPSSAFSLTILATPPAAPSTPALLAADDSGAAGDGITNIRQPRLTGTAASGLTIQLINASNIVVGTAVAAGGAYTIQPASTLTNGGYAYRVQAVDAAGNVSIASGAYSLTILTGSPATPSTPVLPAVDDSGVVGDGLTYVSLPHLTGVGPAGTTLQLMYGVTVLGSTLVASDGTWSVQPSSSLPDGTYSLQARAVDVAGNLSGTSGILTLAIRTAAPAAPAAPSLLAADDTGAAGDGRTSVRLPRLSGAVAAGSTVDLLNASGTVVATTAVGVTGSYSLQPPSKLGLGATTFRARVRDAAGNVSVPGATLTLTIVDASPGDFNGDGKTDLAVFRPSTALWKAVDALGNTILSTTFGTTNYGDIPVPGDYDGNGKTEMAIFRPSTAQWFVYGPNGIYQFMNPKNATGAFGQTGLLDIPVPGDYDNVGYTEPAVFRVATAQWFVLGPNGPHLIANPKTTDGSFGQPNMLDIPVPGDYDGIGFTQPAIFRPSTAQWFVLGSTGGRQIVNPRSANGSFGQTSLLDVPVPGDYDGVGRTQLAVYRPATGQWYVLGANGGRLVGTLGQPNFVDMPVETTVGALKKIGVINGVTIGPSIIKRSITAAETIVVAPPTPTTPIAPAAPKKLRTNDLADRLLAAALEGLVVDRNGRLD